MGWLDQVPRAGELYIGGIYSLRRRDAIEEAKISHVVSVLRWPIDADLVRPYKHLQIQVDDEDDENLLESFPVTNRFIDDALDAGGSVFVHCAMGKSRSATTVCAYLMCKNHMTPLDALSQLREGRGVCEPNPGFMRQLQLYHSMNFAEDIESDPIYQRWLYQRDVDLSRAAGQAPEADKIRFEDEHPDAQATSELELRCRKCRRPLATSQYFIPHGPKQVLKKPDSPSIPPSACGHYFVDPLSWMRPELEQGKLEGRLECPKCHALVGKYAWQGMQCTCADWVLPAISLSKARIDEVPQRRGQDSQNFGIRLPPAARSEQSRTIGRGEEHL